MEDKYHASSRSTSATWKAVCLLAILGLGPLGVAQDYPGTSVMMLG
jgi:hypothetical protein